MGDFLMKLSGTITGGLAGAGGWLVRIIIVQTLQFLYSVISSWLEKQKRERLRNRKINEALKEYEAAIGGKLSREERRKRVEELANAIRD